MPDIIIPVQQNIGGSSALHSPMMISPATVLQPLEPAAPLVRNLLFQVLNPSLLNDNILKATLLELDKANPLELISQRFNFKALKSLINYNDPELEDKKIASFIKNFSTRFSTFFAGFSDKEREDLIKNTKITTNLYNIAQILAQSQNQEVKKFADQFLLYADKLIQSKPHIDAEAIKHVHCYNQDYQYHIFLKPNDFFAFNFAPSYLNAKNRLMSELFMTTTREEKKQFFQSDNAQHILLDILKNQSNSIENPANFIITHVEKMFPRENSFPLLLYHKEVCDQICTDPLMISFFIETLRVTYNVYDERVKDLTKFLNSYEDHASDLKKQNLLLQIIKLNPDKLNLIFDIFVTHDNFLTIKENKMIDFYTKMLHQSQGIETKIAFSLLFLIRLDHHHNTTTTTNYSATTSTFVHSKNKKDKKYSQSFDFLERMMTFLPQVINSKSINLQIFEPLKSDTPRKKDSYLLQTIEQFLKHPSTTAHHIDEHQSVLLRLIMNSTELKKIYVPLMIEKKFCFPSTFELDSKTYQLSGLRLGQKLMIQNEKNMLDVSMSNHKDEIKMTRKTSKI